MLSVDYSVLRQKIPSKLTHADRKKKTTYGNSPEHAPIAGHVVRKEYVRRLYN